ncbi:MAG: YkgJ family cysteine cluster protein [Candidatus Bathyarchaeia archaeon]
MSKTKDICLQYGCIKCCLNTEMPLSVLDIARIKGLGFSEDSFIVKKNGNRQLKNLSGRCVFHNGQRCTIYNHRPEGCQLYPVIFNEDMGEPLLDSYCPHHEEFQLTPSISRKVIRLVRKLDVEKMGGSCDLGNAQNLGIRKS